LHLGFITFFECFKKSFYFITLSLCNFVTFFHNPEVSTSMARVKIICTLGPSSQDEITIQGLIEAGMNIARINFSHGAPEELAGIIGMVKKVAAEKCIPVAILGDLAGPKIRVGDVEGGHVFLEAGRELTITTRTVMGSASLVSTTYPNLVSDVEKGDRILIDDGNLELKVLEVNPEEVKTIVVIGGELKPHKGMNLPGVAVSAPSISTKDFSDMEFAVKNRLDFLGLSFVRTPDDVLKAKKLLSNLGSDMPVIAKIEKQEAVDSFDAILENADGIMVARGDLGVEMPSEEVPLIQKKIIEKCNSAGKPVIAATQMLESMTYNPRPTRAETSDVANAVIDGSDAVMLSGETAVGKYPVKTAETMRSIIDGVEKEETNRGVSLLRFGRRIMDHGELESTIQGAVTIAACRAAEILNATAIVAYTQSGSTARHLSKHRPKTRIVAITPSETIRRRLALHWGVQTVLVQEVIDTDSMVGVAESAAKNCGYARPGDIIVITSGTPIGITGSTNLMNIHLIR
jgi:pyruvate kinase